MRFLLPLLALPLLAVAAPVPKETPDAKMKRLFGEVADAKKGYDFALDGDKLVVTMVANASEKPTDRPPRTEREVTGDFEMRVVLTFAPPNKKFDDAGDNPVLAAGFALWGKDGRHVMDAPHYGTFGAGWNANGWGCGHFRHESPEDEKKATFTFGQNREFVTYKRRHILLRRKDGKFHYGESADGTEWATGGGLSYDLPDTVRVGVFALNTTNAECTATFSDFVVTPLKPK